MTRTLAGALISLLLAPALPAGESTASFRYLNLKRQYARQQAAFQKAYDAAPTPDEKQKVLAEKHPKVERFAAKFLELAREAPTSDFAVEALIWVVGHPTGPATGTDPRSQALDLLRKQHVASDKLGPVCTRLIYSPDEVSEALLRAALAKSPDKGVQARACMSLAQNLKFRGRVRARLADDVALVKQYEGAWGKAVVAALLKRDADALLAESGKLFERVVKQYGKVRHPQHGTLAKMAQAHLAALRDPVTIDKEVPEINGVDHEGKTFALSAQRGKVVLLDFGGSDLPPSRAAWPAENRLVKSLAGRPFVLLGVSADGSKEGLAKVRAAEKLAWRSWWDGGGIGGPIATRWEVELWPTLYLIDHKGVLRNVFVGWPRDKSLDEALGKLVREAEVARKK